MEQELYEKWQGGDKYRQSLVKTRPIKNIPSNNTLHIFHPFILRYTSLRPSLCTCLFIGKKLGYCLYGQRNKNRQYIIKAIWCRQPLKNSFFAKQNFHLIISYGYCQLLILSHPNTCDLTLNRQQNFINYKFIQLLGPILYILHVRTNLQVNLKVKK